MSNITKIKNRQDATMAQQAYINDLYNQLEVPYLKRQRPQTAEAASVLIDELKRQVWDEPTAEKCEGCSHCDDCKAVRSAP